jgi:putative DNA primase/helicase
VHNATADYRLESDVIGLFLAERCAVGTDKSVGATPLYQAYTEWAITNGLRAMTNVSFGRALTERRFTKRRTTGGRYEYLGIGVMADE